MRWRAVLRPKIATGQAYRDQRLALLTQFLAGELCPVSTLGTVADMADSVLQQQLDDVRTMLARARELFGANPVEPPTDIAPAADAVQHWVL
jgi:hypothetical protein